MPGRRFSPLAGRSTTLRKPALKTVTHPNKFDCVVCNKPDSVTVKVNKKKRSGLLGCSNCETIFHCELLSFGEDRAIDVYAQWVDSCDTTEQGKLAAAELEDQRRRVSTTKNLALEKTFKAYRDQEKKLHEPGAAAKRTATRQQSDLNEVYLRKVEEENLEE